METNETVIDFSSCKYMSDLHNEIKQKLQLPDWYGNNLDALWDSLTGIIETPVKIRIIYKPELLSSKSLKDEVMKIVQVFQDASQEYGDIDLNFEM